MKTVYFVRHGEATGNVGNFYQGEDSELTAKGLDQAQFLAKRCAKLPIEVIISSTLTRAQQTAQIISEGVGKPFETSELFVERRKPTGLADRLYEDEEARALDTNWWKSLAGIGPRVLDGENFDDLKKRAGAALSFLGDRPENNSLVVTHGFYMRYLIARALFGNDLTPATLQPFILSLEVENAGISVFHYRPDWSLLPWRKNLPKPDWRVWIWNDHAHLG